MHVTDLFSVSEVLFPVLEFRLILTVQFTHLLHLMIHQQLALLTLPAQHTMQLMHCTHLTDYQPKTGDLWFTRC